jgi:hypothetical protein
VGPLLLAGRHADTRQRDRRGVPAGLRLRGQLLHHVNRQDRISWVTCAGAGAGASSCCQIRHSLWCLALRASRCGFRLRHSGELPCDWSCMPASSVSTVGASISSNVAAILHAQHGV